LVSSVIFLYSLNLVIPSIYYGLKVIGGQVNRREKWD